MKKSVLASMAIAGLALNAPAVENEQYRNLSLDDFRDHLKGGWIGQMAGVGWGSPTEMKSCGRIMPESEMLPWTDKMVNQHRNDDIYVELAFVRSMELNGLDVSAKQAGIDFANTGFSLFCANFIGRNNVRCGYAPPDSGHPTFTHAANDLIDYQIESDYAGLISPGLPNSVIALGEKFGHMMCYGDGVYGGQFVGGMYAEAYFEKDVIKVIEAGLKCIPAESQYAEMVRDMLGWYRQYPENWEKTWGLIEAKYHKDTRYHHRYAEKSIEVKLNGAYILMGLLYGKGDMEKTIQISTRCGQDSDCNPANAGGVLGAILGFSAVPERFKSALDEKALFFASTYNWPEMLRVHELLARQVVVKYGGQIFGDAAGQVHFVIPIQAAQPGPLEKTWEPGPVTGVKYSDEEVAQMIGPIEKFAPGWKVIDCGGPVDEVKKYLGRDNVLQTRPLNETTPCILYTKLELPAGKKSFLSMDVGHRLNYPDGGWFDVRAGKPEVQVQLVKDGAWETVGELSDYPKTTADNNGGLTDGQRFTCEWAKPVKAFAVRVIGKSAGGAKPSQAFSSCSELEAFAD